MDFQKRINNVNMVTPKSVNIPPSTIKQSEQQKSYISLNEFNGSDNEIINLRSLVQILEGKLQFYDKEFQIKQISLEKRIQTLVQTSSQLTQQNAQLQLQNQALMNENQQLGDRLNTYEKNNQIFDDKVRQQLDSVTRLQDENHSLKIQIQSLRERSKTRKQKIKDLQLLLQEQSQGISMMEKDQEKLIYERDQLIQQQQLKIEYFQQAYEKSQLEYQTLIQNVKNHYTENDDDEQREDTMLVSQNQQNLDQEQLKEIENQIVFNEEIKKDLDQFLLRSKHIQQIQLDQLQNNQMQQIAERFNQQIQKIVNLTEKKHKYKNQIQQLKDNQMKLYQGLDQDVKSKYMFEQRILELEQFYLKSNDKKRLRSMTQPFQNNKQLQGILCLMTQFLDEFIKQSVDLQELSVVYMNVASPKIMRKLKKIVWSIIAIRRLKQFSQSQGSKYVIYLPLQIDRSIVATLIELLESIETRKRLLDQIEEQKHKGDYQQNEVELKQYLEKELNKQFKQIKQELDQANNIKIEYTKRMQKEIELRDQTIHQLEKKSDKYDQIIEDQRKRVASIEMEFNQIAALIDQLQ
ncbi:hypothetical protein pb186bvf_015544 [Paramecium bursaria]